MRLARHKSVFLPVFVLVLGSALALAPALHAVTESAAVAPHNPYYIQLAGLVAALQNASAPQAAVLLKRIYELVRSGDMPPWYYKPLHPGGWLSQDEVNRICQWTQTEQQRLASLPR